MPPAQHDFDRLAQLSQAQLWDTAAAQRYDTPGVGMEAPDVLGPTVDRLTELANGGAALEFAIGTGRVAIPLSARGVNVAGVEYSQPMIDRLREKVGETDIPVVCGDMANAHVPGSFSLVYLVFNTIANLLTQEAQVECFRNAARHLEPGGCFVVELWVPSASRLESGVSAEVFALSNDSVGDGGGYIGLDWVDSVEQHVISYHFRFGDGPEARVGRTPHRYITPAELDLMAQLAGLERESRHADWEGSAFTTTSRSHVTVYRKPNGRPQTSMTSPASSIA